MFLFGFVFATNLWMFAVMNDLHKYILPSMDYTSEQMKTATATATATATDKTTVMTAAADDDADADEQQRTVYWLDQSALDDDKADYFSGTWYMPIQNFRSLNAKAMLTVEDASHEAFFENREDVRMTVDWLDFANEHMSRWYKKLDVLSADNNDVAIKKITGNFLKYIQATPARTKALMAMLKSKSKSAPTSTSTSSPVRPLLHPTIAIISFGGILKKSGTVLEMERSRNLTITTLGATITSLLRVGFGRIVCTGIDDIDKIFVMDAFELIRRQYEDYFAKNHDDGNVIGTTELAYVRITDKKMYKTKYVNVNRPRASIYGLQKALTGKYKNKNDGGVTKTEQWLGTVHEPSYWKYVYSTEPDLVLQTRVASLPAIHKALERGRVLMPHRLQPVTHESDLIDYDNNGNSMPAQGKFKDILDIDGDMDMCCDDGIARPQWNKEDDPTETRCYTWWWDCGYTSDWQNLGISEEVKHRRLLYYTPLIRLSQGTNIASISGSEHERKCRPRKRNTPNDICQRPSPSGRSYATEEEEERKKDDEQI